MAETKSAFVTIVGKPNAGKSTLLNRLIGEKIAIVSNKPQTTRTRITGVLTEGETQYVFLDTPGLHRAKNRLSDHMEQAVQDSMADVDVILLVAEPFGKIHPSEQALMEKLSVGSTPVILLLNKIDLLKEKSDLLEQIAMYSEAFSFAAVIPISAETGDGVDILMKELASYAKEGVHYFSPDMITDQPERVILAEILREKLLLTMRDEVPHGVAVTVESMKERENGLIDLHTVIYCEKQSHKGMIIGKGGQNLKKMASAARTEMEHFLDCRVNLQCWVKVKEDWRNKESIIRSFGLS